MGCHFCSDELFMILGVIAGVKYIPGWVRMMWAKRHRKPHCKHEHGHEGGPVDEERE